MAQWYPGLRRMRGVPLRVHHLVPSAPTRQLISDRSFRRAVALVVVLNLAYFAVEGAFAWWTGSVSLFADSIDFLEDATLNGLILLGLGWSITARARLGMVLAAILLVPGVLTAIMAWTKFQNPVAPEAVTMGIVGAGALAVNLCCAFILVRFRKIQGSLSQAAFLSARNDAFANVAILFAAVVTYLAPSGWPDLVVGLGILAMNADAAFKVFREARKESRAVPEV